MEQNRIEKMLGKIGFAEFGTLKDYPFLIGLQLGFSMNGGGYAVCDGGKFTVNISKEYKWENQTREVAITASLERVEEILKAAKANYVSELVGKPVEVTLVNNTFKDFRILTEVL